MTQQETKLFKYMCQHFGTDLAQRMEKLDEEYSELKNAYKELAESNRHYTTFSQHLKKSNAFIDELADVYALVLQIGCIHGISPANLVLLVLDKYKRREEDPSYKHGTATE